MRWLWLDTDQKPQETANYKWVQLRISQIDGTELCHSSGLEGEVGWVEME